MSERVWHKGPPPHVGWWEASYAKEEGVWRWWDGKCWSQPAWEPMSACDAAFHAERPSAICRHCWTDYWPENARVPRLDPTGGHWTFNVDGRKPNDPPERIDLYFRNGDVHPAQRSKFVDWSLDGGRIDILAWRPAA